MIKTNAKTIKIGATLKNPESADGNFKNTKDKIYNNLNVTTTNKVPVKRYITNSQPGKVGEIVYNNVNNKFYGWTPSGWTLLSGGGGDGGVVNVGTGEKIYTENGSAPFELRTLISSDSSITIVQNADTLDLKVVPGGIIQYSTVTTTLTFTLGNNDPTTFIACDNHIPTIGEGVELFNLVFTPKSNSSQIILKGECTFALGSAAICCIAMFDSSLTDALAVGAVSDGFGTWATPVEYELQSWGTTAKTFSIRCGVDGAPPGGVPPFPIYINRVQESTMLNYGGKLKSKLTITELLL